MKNITTKNKKTQQKQNKNISIKANKIEEIRTNERLYE